MIKYELILELCYIPVGSIVKELHGNLQFRVQNEITIIDDFEKSMKTISASNGIMYLVGLNGNSSIHAKRFDEKFIVFDLTSAKAIELIKRIDNGFF